MAGLYGLLILLLLDGLTGADANTTDALQSTSPNPTLPATTLLASTSPNGALPAPTSLASTSPNGALLAHNSSTLAPNPTSGTQGPSALATATGGSSTISDPPSTSSSTVMHRINTTTTPPPTTVGYRHPSQCAYILQPERFGFRINISSYISGDVTVTDADSKSKIYTGTLTGNQTTPPPVNQTTPQPGNRTTPQPYRPFSTSLKYLKPCTAYRFNVTIVHGNGTTVMCDDHHGKDPTKTIYMERNDIEPVKCNSSGRVCYRSDWDLSSSEEAKKYTPTTLQSCNGSMGYQRVLCIKPSFKDICSELSTTFRSGNCPNSTFSLNQSITADFLDALKGEIELDLPDGLPAKIEWINKPKKCNDTHTIDLICQDPQDRTEKDLTNLEAYTNYNCTATIKYSNITIVKTVDKIVSIDCKVKMEHEDTVKTEDSIEISFKAITPKCVNFDQSLTYTCSCTSKDGKHTVQGDVKVREKCECLKLNPFTDYNWKVTATFKKIEFPPIGGEIRTLAGKPSKPGGLNFSCPENNAIIVKCNIKEEYWMGKGPKANVTAQLSGGGKVVVKVNPSQDPKCYFDFRDLSYTTTYTVKVFLNNGFHEGDPRTADAATRYNDKALIGFLVFLIILTSLALLIVVYKIYILQHRNAYDPNGEGVELIPASNEEDQLRTVEPIAAEFLLETYKRKIADEGRLFLDEFQSIPRVFSRNTAKEAKKTSNAIKNRYVDILPYDYNRVQLTTGNGEPGCDYINASYIDGFKESKKYIAAQGPKEETVSDFWRMMWEQQSSIIVMVTRCEEGNKIKCAQYWPSPERETELYEEFIVKLKGEDHCPDYIIRRLSLANKRDRSPEREVTHIQFISWPDHGVPGEPHLLLKLRRRVNAFNNFFSGPIVIHCSAGVGRTGTYIGIDAMMEGLESEGRVDIYGYVVRLRRQRCLMVQVEAQYILIHQALIEHNQFGETEVVLPELHSRLATLKHRSSSAESVLLEEEFQRVPLYKNWRTFNTGIIEENKKKNRFPSVIPYDFNRVLVKLEEEISRDSDRGGDDDDDDEYDDSSDEDDDESTKYINASLIDGYWCPHGLIVTQGPLPNTVGDFWMMVHQKKVKTIIMLSDCTEGDQETCSAYWGKEKQTFGEIEVEVTATDTSPAYTTRTMQIRHVKRKERRPVRQFHFLKWADRELPENTEDLTDMMKHIKQTSGYGQSKADRSTPIVIHCGDGSRRSGVFCALWILLDSAETEKLVDVFQVVKTLRKERQGMIGSPAQYQFLYDAVDRAYPLQNGEVTATAADSVQLINETKPVEQENGSTTSNQQVAAETKPAEQVNSETSLDQQAAAETKPAEQENSEASPDQQAAAETKPSEQENSKTSPDQQVAAEIKPAEQENGDTTPDQQVAAVKEAAESTPLVVKGENEDKKESTVKVEEANNGPTVTLEV